MLLRRVAITIVATAAIGGCASSSPSATDGIDTGSTPSTAAVFFEDLSHIDPADVAYSDATPKYVVDGLPQLVATSDAVVEGNVKAVESGEPVNGLAPLVYTVAVSTIPYTASGISLAEGNQLSVVNGSETRIGDGAVFAISGVPPMQVGDHVFLFLTNAGSDSSGQWALTDLNSQVVVRASGSLREVANAGPLLAEWMHGDAPTFVHALQSALSEVQKGGVNKATNQEDSGPRPSSEEKIETLPPLELPDSTKVYVRYQAQDAGFCFAVSSESNGALSNCLPWASVPDDALLSGRFGSSGEVFLGVVHSDVTTISADGALIKRSATVTTPLGLYSIFEGVIQPGEATPKVEILSK